MLEYLSAIGIICVAIFYNSYSSKTKVYSHSCNRELISIINKKPYKPSLFIIHPYIQGIIHMLSKKKEIHYKRELFELRCGGLVSFDHSIFNSPLKNSKNNRILVILHGLLAGTDSQQTRDIIEYYSYQKNNVFNQIISLQNKGVNDTPLKYPKSYHANSHDDIKEALDYLISKNPNCELYLIGNSMGSLILTNLLAKYKIKEVVAFISISNPFNLNTSSKEISVIMSTFFARAMKNTIKNHPIMFSKFSKEKLDSFKSIKDFEEDYTVEIHNKNFKSVEHYYNTTACDKNIPKLDIPSLFINSYDDNVSPIKTLDKKMFEQNPNTTLICTDTGFHVCFFEGLLGQRRWFLDISNEFFAYHMNKNTN